MSYKRLYDNTLNDGFTQELQSLAYVLPKQGNLGNFDDSDDEEDGTRMVLQVRTALLEAVKSTGINGNKFIFTMY